jgi:hypothetical protein
VELEDDELVCSVASEAKRNPVHGCISLKDEVPVRGHHNSARPHDPIEIVVTVSELGIDASDRIE